MQFKGLRVNQKGNSMECHYKLLNYDDFLPKTSHKKPNATAIVWQTYYLNICKHHVNKAEQLHSHTKLFYSSIFRITT